MDEEQHDEAVEADDKALDLDGTDAWPRLGRR